MFSFFKKPTFEELYKEACQPNEASKIIELLMKAIRAAGTDFDKAGVAMFTLGDVLRRVAEHTNDEAMRERARTTTAQAFTMVTDERRVQLAPKCRALLSLDENVPLSELLSACWEIDARDKLRLDDIQGFLTALQGATSTLSVAYGRDNPKMVAPMWRAMARLQGTSLAQLGSVIGELGDKALAIIEKGGVPVDDQLWTIQYKLSSAAAKGDMALVRVLLERMLTVAKREDRQAFVDHAAKSLEALNGPPPMKLSFAVSDVELEEIKFRSNGHASQRMGFEALA